MKTSLFMLLSLFFLVLVRIDCLRAQSCINWSDPVPFSDSVTDNHEATMVNIPYEGWDFYVFWQRSLETDWSEIVCANYYTMEEPQVVFHGEGLSVGNPQVIPVLDSNQEPDTLAFIFYEYLNTAGYQDIYYTVMTDTGFSGVVPFTNTIANESHLRVDKGGGMVWQEADKIKYSRLYKTGPGFFFGPAVTIDEGNCRNPVIKHAEIFYNDIYIAWEKGDPDSPEIWYTLWSQDMGDWMPPMLLYGDGNHSNIRFSKDLSLFSTGYPILLSDLQDDIGSYFISAYDFYSQDEFISAFSQLSSFQPDMLTIDLITDVFWEPAYLAFTFDEGNGNSDIFSSDNGLMNPELHYYCRVDSTDQPDLNPQLFEGRFHGEYVDLAGIWETWRYGHWQLYTAMTEAIIGSVPEAGKDDLADIKAYPNPVYDQVTFDFNLQSPSEVNLSVFNSTGQLVATIIDGPLGKGKHQLSWDSEGFPAGIYFYLLTDGKLASSGKVIKL